MYLPFLLNTVTMYQKSVFRGMRTENNDDRRKEAMTVIRLWLLVFLIRSDEYGNFTEAVM